MRLLRTALMGSLCVGTAAILAASCAATPDDRDFDTSGSGGSGAGSPGSGGAGGSSGTFTGGVGVGGGSGCDPICSSDLHQILDCNGNVIEECPPDQGCGATGCVPACESARQNKSSIGCDYYAMPPDIIPVGVGACFAAFIANTWGSPVSISVERAGQSFDVSQFARIPSGSGQAITYAPLPNGELPPGEVAILFLARNGFNLTSCPDGITPAFTAAPASVVGTGMGDAFNITTSAPVSAYTIFPYGGGASAATSATLLLPTSVWDTNYVAVDAFRKSQAVADGNPSIMIAAAEDDTQVTINPKVALVGGGGLSGSAANVPVSYTLQRGQVVQFTQVEELIGSPIQSTKPIGVWGAASCLSVDIADVACDSAHQQIPPVKALGHEYAGVRYRNRHDGQEETVPWRMVGGVDGTTLTWDPAPPAGAPSALASGEVAEFWAPGPFVVRSQDPDHPFYMSAHMTGCGRENPSFSDCRGDPEFVNIIPTAQFLTKYTFFTDPTYPETNLVVIRKRTANGFQDVQLDCAGTLGGWTPLGNGGEYEFTRTDLVRGNFEPQGACNNGRHVIESQGPIGLTVWGWGSAASSVVSTAVSYAYPAGASIQPINTVTVPTVPE